MPTSMAYASLAGANGVAVGSSLAWSAWANASQKQLPTDTQRNDNVIITSKRRCDVDGVIIASCVRWFSLKYAK